VNAAAEAMLYEGGLFDEYIHISSGGQPRTMLPGKEIIDV
jgi:hypothetical protein